MYGQVGHTLSHLGQTKVKHEDKNRPKQWQHVQMNKSTNWSGAVYRSTYKTVISWYIASQPMHTCCRDAIQ